MNELPEWDSNLTFLENLNRLLEPLPKEMPMSNHTKGTWKCLGKLIICEDPRDESLTEICIVREHHDNGFLIAAAPEMLEALKKIVFELSLDPEIKAKYKCLTKGYMAIAKAEGRSWD